MKVCFLALALLFSFTSFAGEPDSLELRLQALEAKVQSLMETNPRVIVESECLVKVTNCEVVKVPHMPSTTVQFSYIVRQTLALAFDNGTVSNVTSEKVRTEKTQSSIEKDAKATCEKSQTRIRDLITDCT